MLCSPMGSKGWGRTAALMAWAEAESRGTTRGRQLGLLTTMLPELVKLELSSLSASQHHTTVSEQVRLEIHIWSLFRKNAVKSSFSDQLPFKTDIISLEYSQGYWVSGRGNDWDLTVLCKPNPNTSPDLAQPIRKGNLAPGENRVWSLHLARQPATSEWTFQMRYSVTKKKSSWRC